MLDAVAEALKRCVLLLIACYQRALSPFLGRCCRYHPSCSHYAAESLRKHGLGKGVCKAAWCFRRCHPFSPGGFDPP
jgi:hypothetical protein